MVKKYKIQILSALVIALAIFLIYPKDTINVSVYLEGDNATTATIVELSIDYDKDNLKLISYSPKEILKTWDAKHFVLIPNSSSLDKPIIQFEFETTKLFGPKNIKIDPESQVYLSNTGVVTLPIEGLNFRLSYE